VKKLYEYKFDGTFGGKWSVNSKYPVELIVNPTDPKRISLRWTSSYSGQFELCYGNEFTKTIVVESLF
jgi:hypothetical protein